MKVLEQDFQPGHTGEKENDNLCGQKENFKCVSISAITFINVLWYLPSSGTE